MMAMAMVMPAIAQDNNAWPWDFPQQVKVKIAEGQTVLSPYTYYPKALKEGKSPKEAVLIFYDTTVKKVGEEKSALATWNGEVDMPNALIIPLPKDVKAKKGDVVLTWWQSGSGLERAIVVDDSNPLEPMVCYLDQRWPDNPESPKLAEKKKGEPLKPSSFTVIKDKQWQSGAQVAIHKDNEWLAGKLIHVEGNKVLVLGFSSKVEAYDKGNVRLIPFKEKIKVGDEVWATWVNTYRPGYIVTHVDNEAGRVYVKGKNSSSVEAKSIAEVTKILE